MPRIDVLVLTSVIAALAAGCGGARVVAVSPNGGVIALDGDRNAAMEQAGQMMADHCRGGYQIVEEGEDVSIDENQATDENNEGSGDGTEWRLRYSCGGEPAAGDESGQTPAEGGGPQRAPAPADRPASGGRAAGGG